MELFSDFPGTRHARVTGLWRLGLVLSTPSVQWAEVGRSCSKYREAVQAPLSAVLTAASTGDQRTARYPVQRGTEATVEVSVAISSAGHAPSSGSR